MDLLNGHADLIPKDLQGQISVFYLMGRCSAQPITLSTLKNVDLRGMAPYASCMLRVSVIAAPVPCVSEARENGTATIKPRRVSAVFWPVSSSTPASDEPLPDEPASDEPLLDLPLPDEPSPPPRPVLWGDWPRAQIRRRWFHLLRTQAVLFAFGPVQYVAGEEKRPHDVQTRAQRAHWRFSWNERLARNARLPTAPPLEVTIHGLPVLFAKVFSFDVLTAA